MRDLLQRLELDDVGAVEAVHLLGGERAHRGGGVVAEIDELDLVEVRPAAPVAFLARLEHLLAPDLVGRQREGARAVRANLELAVLRRVQDEERVVEELLGHGELGRLAVQPDREVVHLLDGVGVPEAGRFLGIALVVLLARLDILEEKALHQAEHGRAGLGVEHSLQVPHDVVGGELPAVVPLDVPAQTQRPRLQVGAGLPFLDEARTGDVVHAGHREIVQHLTRGVGGFHPAICVGTLDVLAAHGEPQGAALGQGALSLRRRDQPLAGDLAHEGIGGRCRHAEQGRVAQELAPLDLALDELALECGQKGMFVSGSHGQVLPGAIVSAVVVSLSYCMTGISSTAVTPSSAR